jgi:hypothetical protein
MIASLHADGILGSDRWTWSDMRELKTGKSLQNTGPVLREGLNSRKLIVWKNSLKKLELFLHKIFTWCLMVFLQT